MELNGRVSPCHGGLPECLSGKSIQLNGEMCGGVLCHDSCPKGTYYNIYPKPRFEATVSLAQTLGWVAKVSSSTAVHPVLLFLPWQKCFMDSWFVRAESGDVIGVHPKVGKEKCSMEMQKSCVPLSSHRYAV